MLIHLKDVVKVYNSKNQQVEALRGVTLDIKAGEIYGIIGYSGAGKSTLIRCMNLLERPTSGTVTVNGLELTSLSPRELRQSRKKIGMIFQHFNLMRSRNVFQNISYPLRGEGLSKNEIKNKVLSLLDVVGLKDKVHAYPSQLSGGEKQRVAIARALASDPEVLLCDEPTSALDPQTTQSILRLLRDINQQFKLTIVVVTHEMQVIKEICHRVAVMEQGKIVEEGEILQIFSTPKALVTKQFIATVFQLNRADELLRKDPFIRAIDENEILAILSFTGQKTRQAFISKISRLFEIDVNILFGNIEIVQETPLGNLVVKLNGKRENMINAIKYLEGHSIHVEVLKDAGDYQNLDPQCSEIVS